MLRKTKRLLAFLLAANMLFPMALSAADDDSIDPVIGSEEPGNDIVDVTEEPDPDEPVIEEDDGISVMSILPLKEIEGRIDLSSYMTFEIPNLTVAEVLEHFSSYGSERFEMPEGATTVWSIEIDENGYVVQDDWNVHSLDEKIDLTTRNGSISRFQIIVGSGNQLDSGNIRLITSVNFPWYYSEYNGEVYTQGVDENGDVVRTRASRSYSAGRDRTEDGEQIFELYMDISSGIEDDEPLYVSIKPKKSGYDLKYIAGFYDNAEAALEAVQNDPTLDLTDGLGVPSWRMNNADAGYKYENWAEQRNGMDITIVYSNKDDGSVVNASKVRLYIRKDTDSVSLDGFYHLNEDGSRNYISWSSGGYKNGVRTYSFNPTSDVFTENDNYQLTFRFFDSESLDYSSNDKIDKAVVGHFDSLEAAADAEDIKDALFGEGYVSDSFGGDGINFTVFAKGKVYKFTIKLSITKPEVKPEPTEDEVLVGRLLSEDKYFRAYTVVDAEGNELDTYFLPIEHDTLGLDGYQTIFVNDTEADMTSLSPKAAVGNGANIYHDGTPEKIVDGALNVLTARDFTLESTDPEIYPDDSAVYTVTAENLKAHRNYSLTVVKKSEGAKLFVNGPDKRTVFLNDFYGDSHDIFIANLGTEELTGLKVELDATNVKLDEYYTVGGEGNDTLAPFTTTEKKDADGNVVNYGELMNVAKIRLLRDGDGKIEGTLTIKADGQEDRVIEISGLAGDPKIDTDGIREAVKYVPYQSIITTNNMFEWNTVEFSLDSGNLPDGVTLLPDGEIYGVPKTSGKFTFSVKAEFSSDKFFPAYKTFVLNVLDNTDENVEGQIDAGFEIITRVDDVTAPEDRIFEFEYDYAEHAGEFQGVWLDGERLTESVDYDVDAGSTKITLRSQTFRRTDPGKHTLAAEYRNTEDEVRKSAQNFNKNEEPRHDEGSQGGGITFRYCTVDFETNGGDDIDRVIMVVGGRLKELPTPVKDGYTFAGWYTDEALTERFEAGSRVYSDCVLYAAWNREITEPIDIELPFDDVKKSDWFWKDVAWAYQNELVKGITSKLFAPDMTVTGGMVVTVLARMANVDISEYEDAIGSGSLWYTPYVNWAEEAGLLDGIPFDSAAEISRENMGMIMVRFMNYVGADYSTTGADVEFSDEDQISVAARPYMQTLTKLRVFRGRGNDLLDPLSLTTRAEFAALAHRIYAIIK